MSLFPFFGDISTGQGNELPIYKEVAWDVSKNIPLITNGDIVMLYGNDAIQTWCYKSLLTNRYRWRIYSDNYGSEIESLIGQNYSKIYVQAECERYVKECLMINPYIKSITNVTMDFNKGLLEINCNLVTVYGTTSLEGVNLSV
ncbi:MAG: hypothetical protein BEN18_10250 [Epulopiscium sp. Nuni2H_MBin001]|nr:MAG: hypothetical protein BEN18_10250 [Epulopiscium sp. Nuni2H_MBin001]